MAFSPDGTALATAALNGTVRLWGPASGADQGVFPIGPAQGQVLQAAFAPDGRHLATANGNGTVYILRLPPELWQADPDPLNVYPGKAVDLLPLIDPAGDRVRGEWKVGRELSSTPSGDATIQLAAAPHGSYELRARFTRTAGKYSVNYHLPVGPASCLLVLSGYQDGDVSGLATIDGKGPDQNVTRVRPAGIVTGRRHDLLVRVLVDGDGATVAAELDGKPYLRWTGPTSALKGGGIPDPARLAVGSYEGTAVFHRLELRVLSGYARLARAPARSPPPAK